MGIRPLNPSSPRIKPVQLSGASSDWWWALIGIKALAALGLIVGAVLNNPSITTTVSVGVLAYFIFAIIAHIKANFVGKEFWVNCLGMTILSAVVLVLNFAAMG
ncbi:hypothetical protein [Corynebacterium sp. KPL2838]|uniref:hypothetical protein n=1 Tax=Corynebacterium sp. KPL2838 TaxID=3158316 RepID=UPI0032EE296E